MVEERPYCKEYQQSKLWSGRMCWSVASYRCTSCGKPVCHEHKRDAGENPGEVRVNCLSCTRERVTQAAAGGRR